MRRRLATNLERSSGGRLSALTALPMPSKVVLGLLVLLALAAVLAPVIAPFDPLASGDPVTSPGGAHWFGTDAIGRDVFSRVLHGARSSLIIGLAATALALAVAVVLGSIAATSGKVVSEVLMRFLDVVMSFPGIALAAVFVAVFGNGVAVLVFAIGFVYVPQLARVVRANVLAQFGEDYVSASRVMGASTPWILAKHVARNTIAPVMVFATVLVADAIVFEASLSFINAGVEPPAPSWGNVLADGKEVLLSGAWWPTFFPGVLILITVLCLNVLSEGLTDTFAAPRVSRGVDADADVDADEERAGDRAALGSVDDEEARNRLDDNLATLRVTERQRGGRLEFTEDVAPLLEVSNLSIAFPEAHGEVDIVDDISFSVRPGETMGLVGESGCGKSITAMAIMGLLPPSADVRGEVRFDGTDVLDLDPAARNALRGHEMAMVYQDALSSLNPSMLVRKQLDQLIRRGGRRSATDLMELVGLDPKRTLESYPHELSGGQRQRVLIAMALTRNPRLVIADEPTTALDVTVQQQVVDLLNDLRSEIGFATVFVSHDLALVARLAHRVSVMYAGQLVEQGTTAELLEDPRHEYTRGLLGSVLSIETGAARLHQVRGTVPSPREFVAGDRFAPRSSRPGLGLTTRPTMREIPGTTHRYASTDELEADLTKGGAR